MPQYFNPEEGEKVDLRILIPAFMISELRRGFEIGFLIVLPLVGLTALALQPAPPEYITAAAERGELRQTVEAVGTVISERDLNLQFPISGIVSEVLVKEGDRVTAGQALARLRAGNIAADISAASGREIPTFCASYIRVISSPTGPANSCPAILIASDTGIPALSRRTIASSASANSSRNFR